MTITNGYATLDELKTKLGETGSDHDTLFEKSIEEASRMIDTHTQTFFYNKTITSEVIDYYAMSENGFVIKSNFRNIYAPAPIISIDTLTEDGTTLTENTDFYIYKSQGMITRDGAYWSTDHRAMVLTGHIGYESVPFDIRGICLTIAEILSGKAIRTVIDEDGDVTSLKSTSVPRWVWDKLDRWIWSNV